MLLVTVATEHELRPLRKSLPESGQWEFLVTGMGPFAAAASLSRYLALHGEDIQSVLNIGVGGAYAGSGLHTLDVCLARQEVFGDFGICMQDEIADFAPGLSPYNSPLELDKILRSDCREILQGSGVQFAEVNFVTVSCCSGTQKRGDYLQAKFSAGCENMEGAAVAMVCSNFQIPCAELRSISNMVEDRGSAVWVLDEAINRICMVAETVLQGLARQDS